MQAPIAWRKATAWVAHNPTTTLIPIEEPDMTVQLIRTEEEPVSLIQLTDCEGNWLPLLPDDFGYLKTDYPDVPAGTRFNQGDPRGFLGHEEASLAVKEGQIGLLITVELEAVEIDSEEDRSRSTPTVEFIPEDYQEIVNRQGSALQSLIESDWPGKAEVFLADGPMFFDHRLCACAFIPITQDDTSGYVLAGGLNTEDAIRLYYDMINIVG